MPSIFISYAREDESRVRPLVQVLEQQKWQVFWDRRIPAGQSWRSHIGRALTAADCVIVVWSAHGVESTFVEEEADEGKRRGLLVPVMLDPVTPPLGFRNIHAADLSSWRPNQDSPAMQQLLADIATVLRQSALVAGPPGTAVPTHEVAPVAPHAPIAPTAPPTMVSPPVDANARRRRVLFASLLLAIGVTGGSWWVVRERVSRSDVPAPIPATFSRSDADNSWLKTLWPVGATVQVRFINGDENMRRRVREIAQQWTRYANLHFDFTDNAKAPVRIELGSPNGGSWSYPGNKALEVPFNQPTMRLGVLSDGISGEEFRFTVLHEFGHVLGLLHETQNPNADIAWNRDVVYREYSGPPNHWSRSQIERQFFERDAIPRTGYRAFDAQSVMWYQLPDKLFVRPPVQRNSAELSAGDKAFSALLYPGVAPTR